MTYTVIYLSNNFLNVFRGEYEVNKSALSAHITKQTEQCIAYDPQGPTHKSWDGVNIHGTVH